MAFRQPTYHAPQRIYTTREESSTVPHRARSLDESEEWILFSPGAASTTDRTYTSGKTFTAGRSRISDLGSLDSAARWGYGQGSEHTVEEEDDEDEDEGDDDDDDGELDSLDTHLHEFRAEGSLYAPSQSRNTTNEQDSSQPVLPRHDGLGSFRLDHPAIGDDAQQHLYAFEIYNPRRVKRRRESLELGQLELEGTRSAEDERTRRIEEWRMEQSRLLIDEIQKETRRRKMSMSTDRRLSMVEREQEDMATMSNVESSSVIEEETAEEENEGFWKRITKRVIHDLMGIDDDLLSIILGEALPKDELSSTPRQGQSLSEMYGATYLNGLEKESSWEYKLLNRIARELGILVHQLHDHPGAFSTYQQVQQAPLPYAGLPVIPETAKDQAPEPQASNLNSSAVEFQPTIQTTLQPVAIPTPTSPINGPELDPMDATPRPANPLYDATPLSAPEPLTREEWEQDLDIKMVFRYLRSRFSSRPATTPASSYQTSHLAIASTSDTAARAARVRQHHPLVTRPHQHRRPSIEKRTFKVTMPRDGSQVAGGPSAMHRRSGSSCASERTRVSAKLSGSSRHYWDIGGSTIGSGSVIASTGAMGSWGDI
ncbi:hypothetical protein F5884DRAFT_660183 [Xylogone sp. PMI_703]|nr:hypothetical protein F5884DRAFT_660183 [Xylogone sp. PMI_703]